MPTPLFEKGRKKTGGGQKGRSNKATKDFKEFWREFFEGEDYRENLKSRIMDGGANHMETYITQLLYGKPREQAVVSGEDGGPMRFTLNIGGGDDLSWGQGAASDGSTRRKIVVAG